MSRGLGCLPAPKYIYVLTVVNVRTVKNALKLNENVMQNYFSICIYSSAATLKVVIKIL